MISQLIRRRVWIHWRVGCAPEGAWPDWTILAWEGGWVQLRGESNPETGDFKGGRFWVPEYSILAIEEVS